MKTKIMRKLNRVGLKLKKHSPEILLTIGVISAIGGTIAACKATTKLGDILDKNKEDIDAIHNAIDDPEISSEEYVEENNHNKDIMKVYANTAIDVAKIYAPAILLETFAVVCILSSHNIIKQRNVALTAACTALDKSFKEYRSRVVDRFGNDMDRELRYDIKARELEEAIMDEKGKEKTIKKNVNVAEAILEHNEFAKFFDPTSREWKDDPEYNLMFLRAVQEECQRILLSKGHLTLNEVYQMLDIEETKAGIIAGWVDDGLTHVDFGIYDGTFTDKRRFVNGLEPVIILDFNCTTNILEKM